MCTERPKPRLDYWGGKCSEPQSATEHATSTSRQNCVQIQYLNPSRLERVARASGPNIYYSYSGSHGHKGLGSRLCQAVHWSHLDAASLDFGRPVYTSAELLL